MKQVRKQRAVMKHRYAKLFHTYVCMLMLHGNIVREPVILRDGRVIY